MRTKIRLLLEQPQAKLLCEEIVQPGLKKSVSDVLVPPQLYSPVATLDSMHRATKDCLDKIGKQKEELIETTKVIAREVFGWLVLLAVDIKNCSGLGFDPKQGGIEIAIPLETEAGTEVLVASLGDRFASFLLKYDNQKQLRIAGKDTFTIDDLEDGPLTDDRLTGILRRIWIIAKFEGDPPKDPEQLQKKLKAQLEGRERRKEGHYYMTIPSGYESSLLTDEKLLTKLLQALPSLRVIYIGREQGERMLLLDEYELWEAIVAFLLMLRDAPS